MARDPHRLREEAAAAIARGKHELALSLYTELEQLEPAAATWPKRVGETHRRMGNTAAAIEAFERAVDRYVADGLLVQAIAVCKMVLQIAPTHVAIATKLAQLATPSPAEVRAIQSARKLPEPQRTRVSLPPGRALDAIQLAPVMPDAKRINFDDGTYSGITLIPVEIALDEIDTVDPAAGSESRPLHLGPAAGSESRPLHLGPAAGSESRPLHLGPAAGSESRPLHLGPAAGSESRPLHLGPAAGSESRPLHLGSTRAALLATPVFSRLPQPTLERLIEKMELVDRSPGAVVFCEGEPGDRMFVVAEGEVIVETNGHELARLGAGAFFGEIALVTDLPRSATARAVGRVELLAIDRALLREAAGERPEIISVLLGFIRDRLVDRITRTSELFEPFTEDERHALAQRYEVVEVDADTSLITQGTRADGLYIVMAGKVDVVRDGTTIATLSTGDVFGEMSLLAGRGSIASVRTATRVLALRMPATTFREVIMTYPQVLAYLGDLSSRRSLLKQAEDLIDLHIDML